MKRNLIDEIDDVVERAQVLQKLGINICARINPSYVPQAQQAPVKKQITPVVAKNVVIPPQPVSNLGKIILGVLTETGMKASDILGTIRNQGLAQDVPTKDLPQLLSATLTELKQAGKVSRSEDLKYRPV